MSGVSEEKQILYRWACFEQIQMEAVDPDHLSSKNYNAYIERHSSFFCILCNHFSNQLHRQFRANAIGVIASRFQTEELNTSYWFKNF